MARKRYREPPSSPRTLHGQNLASELSNARETLERAQQQRNRDIRKSTRRDEQPRQKHFLLKMNSFAIYQIGAERGSLLYRLYDGLIDHNRHAPLQERNRHNELSTIRFPDENAL